LAISGSKNFEDYQKFCSIMESFINSYGPIKKIVSGGAKGVDSLARKFCKERGIPLKEFLPRWKKYGKAAGPIRNSQIISEADAFLAIWNGTSTGTLDAILKAHQKKLPIRVIYLVENENSPWRLLPQLDRILFIKNDRQWVTRCIRVWIPEFPNIKSMNLPALVGKIAHVEVYASKKPFPWFKWITQAPKGSKILVFDPGADRVLSQNFEQRLIVVYPQGDRPRGGNLGKIILVSFFEENKVRHKFVNL